MHDQFSFKFISYATLTKKMFEREIAFNCVNVIVFSQADFSCKTFVISVPDTQQRIDK